MKKLSRLMMLAVAVALMKSPGVAEEAKRAQACTDPVTAKSILGIDNPSNSPVDVVVAAENANPREGIRLKVTIKNMSDKPYPLSVCTNMLMCPVERLHPMVAFDGAGMGLYDMCKDVTGRGHAMKISVAPKADYATDVTIPAARIPANAREKGKELSVFFCFELGDGKSFHSNVVRVTLAE